MPQTPILDTISAPRDLRRLTEGELGLLAEEIRGVLIETVSKNGGHLASNLGVVELTLALHRVFSSPSDQIVWDVGHQCYTHKLVTGRKERFSTIRTGGGLAGYPKIAESAHDTFVAGHSGNSISAAIGLAKGKMLRKEPGHVIAVVGDGSFTNGMIYEALNNARTGGERLIVILNDNDMSISKSVGELARYLADIRSRPGYFKTKDAVDSALKRVPGIGQPVRRMLLRYKKLFKQALYNSNLFENFGFTFLGPVDGHNLHQLHDILGRAKGIPGPVLVHVKTVKGKGYQFAEEKPDMFHGVSRFNVETGYPDIPGENSFSNVFGCCLAELAERDKRICAVTAAMEYGTGLQHFRKRFGGEGRFFDVGIAEEHAVTFCAGLAAAGMIPVFAVYSTFLQRSVDQVLHDVAIDRRHVVLCVDRAGIVGDDGETHQGTFDVALLSPIPNLTIDSPATFEELKACLEAALFREDGPCAVRYPRGSQWETAAQVVRPGEPWQLLEGEASRILLVTYGREFNEVLGASEDLKREGIPCSILKLCRIRPLPQEAVSRAAGYGIVLFIEEGSRRGGVGEAFGSMLLEQGFRGKFRIKALDSVFVQHNTIPAALAEWGLDRESLHIQIKELLEGDRL